MKKIIPALLFGLLIVFFNCSNSTEEQDIEETVNERPNILLVIADDMSLDATPNYAEELNALKPVMPTLEKLMATGLVFDNLWSYALCSPTRASILTGKHGLHTGVLEPIIGTLSGSHKSIQTYIDEQTNNAYVHAVFGKWHLGAVTTHPTQTMGIGTYAGSLRGEVSDYWSYDFIENEEERTLSATTEEERKENYSTTKYTQMAIDWREQQTKPWFLWLAYNAAHTPFHRPDDDLISADSRVRGESNLNNYLAMLEAMDTELGRLIESMSDAEKENTVILFIGDNGTPKRVSQFADKSRHSKGSIYQGGINVPMVISGTGVRMGRESNALVHTADLFATIAGITVDTINNSKSFKGLLESEFAETRKYIYTEVPGSFDNGSYAVRNKKHKLIYEIDTDRMELYNLMEDPYENEDLILGTLTKEETGFLADLVAEGKRVRDE